MGGSGGHVGSHVSESPHCWGRGYADDAPVSLRLAIQQETPRSSVPFSYFSALSFHLAMLQVAVIHLIPFYNV